jgi:hypothetical protein
MNKFNVGDRVRLNGKDRQYIPLEEGDEGVVQDFGEHRNGGVVEYSYIIKMKSRSCKWGINEENIELVPEKEKAKRYNKGKLSFDQLPLLGLIEVSKAGMYGEEKYGRFNWTKGGPASQYFNCAIRHLFKWWYGEDNDDESKCNHLGHAAWNILALLFLKITGKLDDDRLNLNLDMTKTFKVEDGLENINLLSSEGEIEECECGNCGDTINIEKCSCGGNCESKN